MSAPNQEREELVRPELDPRRKENVGASESPSLFSLDWDPTDELRPFRTRLQLWLDKAGRLPATAEEDPGERAFWGQHLEPSIANGLSVLTGWALRRAEFALHPAIEGMSASPDYFVSGARDLGLEAPTVLELKTVDRYEFRRWRNVCEPDVFEMRRSAEGIWIPAERQPPFRIKLQVQHQLACLPALQFAVIAVLVGGNDLRVFRIPRHDGVIERIEREVVAFWKSIEANEPPEPDWVLDAETLVAIFGETDPDRAIDLRDSSDALAAAKEYATWRELGSEADKKKAAAKARLLSMMDRAERALLADGYRVGATKVKGGPVSYVREDYRSFSVTQPRPKRRRRQ